ncbi:carboxypeptidase M32 [Pseudoflavitalea rhizosphaerae]|uniref:carboxypeptidase M32 n=1 Tax=Pseudoflavitalea rhizosphaerae TaxID=1884793 RepID=UPI001F49ACAE|nr:carboxypeptidase M32 [Pseudoflavitalea rhizosphaerae]
MITSTNSAELYSQYQSAMRRIADIRYASAVLQWDQETYLPPKGAGFRGQQLATLSEIAHEEFTADKLGVLLQELSSRHDLDAEQQRNVALTMEDYNRNKKFTAAFVRHLTEVINKSYHSWIEARKANSFSVFAGDLAELVKLKKEEAEILGYQHHCYDALLNDYDKGSNVQLLDKTFDTIREPLKELLQKIQGRPQVNNSFLQQHFPKDKQWDFGMQLIRELGYDLEAGRQDISEHPFTTNFNSLDVRVTTRIDVNDLGNMVWSCIHEAGHAMYEQGLPELQYGLPLGEAASLTIHESQSRLWENHVGRSLAWCKHYLPVLQQYFPEQLQAVNAEQFYKGINQVTPSLIRTEADELTYHFHVMIRYELEKALLENTITTADIPTFWNERYMKYMNVKIPNDKLGCLQDVHWSHGSFGYFPTYSLGSFYAAQFFAMAEKSIPGLDIQIQKGETHPLLSWLREQVHRHGRMYNSEELCRKVTGETLNISYFLQYLQRKYGNIYA